MLKILRNRWFQIAAFPVVGVVVSAIVSFLVFSNRDTEDTLLVNQLIFATGSSGAAGQTRIVGLPSTGPQAVAAGWKDPVLCTTGRGRYFTQDRPGEDQPFILMYDKSDLVVGVYLYSEAEMPPPWTLVDDLTAGSTLLDFEHWGLFVYNYDPTRACTTREEGSVDAVGSGMQHESEMWQTGSIARGTPTPVVAPTPTPTAGTALADGAKRMVALKSLSFTLTAGEDGGPLMAGMKAGKVEGTVVLPDQVTLKTTEAGGEPQEVPADSLPFMFDGLGVTLAGILEGLQNPADGPRKWIENVPTRGFLGSVTGEQLKDLIPSAIPDATAAISLWIGEDGLIRRLEIQGPLTPDDVTTAVRVLALHGFDE